MIMRILRGSGTRGLSGIPPVRNGIFIRPLIAVWREEIESYLREKSAGYLTDPSNQSAAYLRNRIRHEILPLLQQYNPRIRQVLVQMADLFRGEEEFWETHLTSRGRTKSKERDPGPGCSGPPLPATSPPPSLPSQGHRKDSGSPAADQPAPHLGHQQPAGIAGSQPYPEASPGSHRDPGL